eukprot:765451-Hanusia_phi.AAC.1
MEPHIYYVGAPGLALPMRTTHRAASSLGTVPCDESPDPIALRKAQTRTVRRLVVRLPSWQWRRPHELQPVMQLELSQIIQLLGIRGV